MWVLYWDGLPDRSSTWISDLLPPTQLWARAGDHLSPELIMIHEVIHQLHPTDAFYAHSGACDAHCIRRSPGMPR